MTHNTDHILQGTREDEQVEEDGLGGRHHVRGPCQRRSRGHWPHHGRAHSTSCLETVLQYISFHFLRQDNSHLSISKSRHFFLKKLQICSPLCRDYQVLEGKHYIYSIASSHIMRVIPLAIKSLGIRHIHFQVALNEFATLFVKRPEGCPFLQGPLAISHRDALQKIMNSWRSTLTWTT